MYHSITFSDGHFTDSDQNYNTWEDWGLIPTSPPMFVSPDPKTNYVDIPGADGGFDLTETVVGYPTYNVRRGSFEFVVADQTVDAHTKAHNILQKIHGRTFNVMLEDDPNYYYVGRFTVDYKIGAYYSTITFGYVADPYKNDIVGSLDPWKWDPFNFETGVIRDYGSFEVAVGDTVEIVGSLKRSPLVAYASVDMEVSFAGSTLSLTHGVWTTFSKAIIGPGTNKITILKGNGTFKVDYRGGHL